MLNWNAISEMRAASLRRVEFLIARVRAVYLGLQDERHDLARGAMVTCFAPSFES